MAEWNFLHKTSGDDLPPFTPLSSLSPPLPSFPLFLLVFWRQSLLGSLGYPQIHDAFVSTFKMFQLLQICAIILS